MRKESPVTENSCCRKSVQSAFQINNLSFKTQDNFPDFEKKDTRV